MLCIVFRAWLPAWPGFPGSAIRLRFGSHKHPKHPGFDFFDPQLLMCPPHAGSRRFKKCPNVIIRACSVYASANAFRS